MGKDLQIGASDYYERLYEVEEVHWWYRGIYEAAHRILNTYYRKVKGLRVLDAGCGTGFTFTWLEQHGSPIRGVGIDISWHAFPFCRRRGQHILLQASVLELPFKDDLFDLVVCKAVIQHLPGEGSDKVALKEFYRVLNPGGCLLLVTRSSQKTGEEEDKPAIYRTYSLDEVRDKIMETGFHILKLSHFNMLGAMILTVRRYLRHGRKDYEHYGYRLPHRHPSYLQWLNALLYWVTKGEAWFISRPFVTSSFGQTIVVLAKKPASSH